MMNDYPQSIITYPGMSGYVLTVGIVIVEATEDLAWTKIYRRFGPELFNEMRQRGMNIAVLADRPAEEKERCTILGILPL